MDNLRNIGEIYITTGKYKEAELALKKALIYSDSIGHMRGIEAINNDLSILYDSLKNPKLAFEHYKKYIIARDRIASEENQKKQIRTEMNYEFEKKEAVIKEKQEKEREIAKKKSDSANCNLVGCNRFIDCFSICGIYFKNFKNYTKTKINYRTKAKRNFRFDTLR